MTGMSAIETELKLIVDGAGDFRRLLDSTPHRLDSREQLNLYLDTPDRGILAAGAAFRLRISGDRSWATVKRRDRGPSGGVYVSREIEDELTREAALNWLEGQGALPLSGLVDFGDLQPLCVCDRLEVVTWSWTRRTRFRLSGDMILEADETRFADGTVDFEMEIEHPDMDRARTVARELAIRAGIHLEDQVRTKHGRAMSHRGDRPWPLPPPTGKQETR